MTVSGGLQPRSRERSSVGVAEVWERIEERCKANRAAAEVPGRVIWVPQHVLLPSQYFGQQNGKTSK